jgi:hypothetical protein
VQVPKHKLLTINQSSNKFLSPPDKIAAAAGLQPDDMTAQVAELVAEHAAPDERLHAHVASAHAQIVTSTRVRSPILLDEYGGSAHFQESAPNF